LSRGDATREKLLLSAISHFHGFGYNKTSIKDIVSEANVLKGSFYNYFKSKESVAIAASDLFYSVVLSHLKLENTSSPLKRLRKFVRFIVGEMRQTEFTRGCLVGDLAAEVTIATPELKQRIADHLDEAARRLAVVIAQAQQAGEINPALPTLEFSRFILNSLNGAILGTKAEGTDASMRLFERFAIEPFVIKPK